MNRLEEQYHETVDFLHFNVDLPETRRLMTEFGVRSRSSYLLLAPDGTVVQAWFGPLPGNFDATFASALADAQP